jgi:hypothetical protein
MRTTFDAVASHRAPAEDIRRRESRVTVATIVIFFALAAGATAATVNAYGPVFLAPAFGP